MLNVKFYSDRYRRLRYNLKDFMVDERRSNYLMKKGGIGLSVPKGYSLLCNH